MIKIKRGLDLPISGVPSQEIEEGANARHVALVGYDYPGLKPTMEVQVGDKVVAGQLVFTCKKNNGLRYTAPASGTVAAINRGAKRVFQSLVIDVEGDEALSFTAHGADNIGSLDRQVVVDQLVESGHWTALRTRPFGKAPEIDAVPEAIFVTAMDTRPHAVDPALFINEHKDAFVAGLETLARLTEGQVFVCAASDAVPVSNNERVQLETFSGPHPAGLASTHIHFLRPVHMGTTVWVIDYTDVVAFGKLIAEGELFFERLISLAGPMVENPRLVRTRMGASTDEIVAGQLSPNGEPRVISGSVLDGRTAASATAYLGRFHHQVAALQEGRERELLEFVMPGTKKFSLTRLYLGSLFGKQFAFTTSSEGSERSMIPLGSFEGLMPLDILPTQLLRALLVGDLESAIELGALELDVDDLALCTYACPGKYEYGPYLREMLDRIESES